MDIVRDLTYVGRMWRRAAGVVTIAVAGLGIALGATRRDVVRMLLGDSLRPVVLGLGAGIVTAAGAGRLIAASARRIRSRSACRF